MRRSCHAAIACPLSPPTSLMGGTEAAAPGSHVPLSPSTEALRDWTTNGQGIACAGPPGRHYRAPSPRQPSAAKQPGEQEYGPHAKIHVAPRKPAESSPQAAPSGYWPSTIAVWASAATDADQAARSRTMTVCIAASTMR